MVKEHGLYKYVYDGQIIYIGKSNNSIKSRINGHKKERKFQPYLDKAMIYFCLLPNSAETDIMEKALINHYKPILNVDLNRPGFSNLIHIEEPIWKIYHDDLANKPEIKKSENVNYIKKKMSWKKASAEKAIDDAIAILDKMREERKNNHEFIEAYEFLLSKIEDNDYLCVINDYLRKGVQEPLFRFDITELIKKDIWKALFYHGGFPFYRRKSTIAGRTYVYIRDLGDIKNLVAETELNSLKSQIA